MSKKQRDNKDYYATDNKPYKRAIDGKYYKAADVVNVVLLYDYIFGRI